MWAPEEEEEEWGEEKTVSLKGALWRVVRAFIKSTTKEEPYPLQHFFFNDFIAWHQKIRGFENVDPRWLNHLMGRFDDIFSKEATENEGDSIWLESIWNEEEAEEEMQRAKTSICVMVSSFIKGTMNKEPCKGQMFSLTELQDWVVKEYEDRNGPSEVI